jgi:hypothetical protein
MKPKPDNTQEAALSTIAVPGTHPRAVNRSAHLIAWCPPEMKQGLDRLAEENGSSVSAELRRAVRLLLRLHEPDDLDP